MATLTLSPSTHRARFGTSPRWTWKRLEGWQKRGLAVFWSKNYYCICIVLACYDNAAPTIVTITCTLFYAWLLQNKNQHAIIRKLDRDEHAAHFIAFKNRVYFLNFHTHVFPSCPRRPPPSCWRTCPSRTGGAGGSRGRRTSAGGGPAQSKKEGRERAQARIIEAFTFLKIVCKIRSFVL